MGEADVIVPETNVAEMPELMRGIKRAFDPKNILNTDKIFKRRNYYDGEYLI